MVLSCRNLSVGYAGTAVARDISFNVGHGDYLVIVGENGAGKSTLVSTILGLVPPVAGELAFTDGRPAVGYLPQSAAIMRDVPARAEEVVLSGCLRRGLRHAFFGAADRRRAERAMRRTGAADLAPRSFSELSGGQRQRVLLARALCAADQLLVLDEPVSSLDPQAAADMYGLIRSLNRDDGMSIIAVTHDLPAGLADATHVLHVGPSPFFGTRVAYRGFVETHPAWGAWEDDAHELV